MEELYAKSAMKPKGKRHFTENQVVAIQREKVKKYFAMKWSEKYGLPFVMPRNEYMGIDKPIADFIKAGYTPEMIQKGVDCYLDNTFDGYVKMSHPIDLFIKRLSSFVVDGRGRVQKEKEVMNGEDVGALNAKYGILRKGDCWITEDGRVFAAKEDAIKHSEKNGGVTS